MKLLLHTCCGPCFLGVWEDLKSKDLVVTNYFYNPNIYPEAEYAKRLDNLQKAIIGKTEGLVIDNYDPNKYETMVLGLDSRLRGNDGGERCLGCYRLRLESAARYAKEHGFDAFSTTLLVSPYQQHEALKQICEEVSEAIGIKFYYTDWRPFFRKGQDEAKIIPIYRQKYCGCKYSLPVVK